MMNQFFINFGFVITCVVPLRLKRLSGSIKNEVRGVSKMMKPRPKGVLKVWKKQWRTVGQHDSTENATKGWRKPTAGELTRNLKMLPHVYIPATPPSLMSNELRIPPTPKAEEVIKK